MYDISKNEEIEQILEKYSDMVYRLALSRTRNIENAEDIFQEVFLKLSRKMPKFDGEEHKKAWLIRVTINCSNNLHKLFWNNKITQLDENTIAENQEDMGIFYEVEKLPLNERTIIYLFYYERLKLSEIGEILGITENATKTKLFRAREKLKERLGDFDE